MSRGQFKPQNNSDGVLGRCQNKRCTDKVLKIFDVDKGEIAFVNTDVPMSSHQGSRCFSEDKSNEASNSDCVIMINDEDSCDAFPSEKVSETDSTDSYYFGDDEYVVLDNKRKETKKARFFSKGSCSRNEFDFINSFGQSSRNDFPVVDVFDEPGEYDSSGTLETSEPNSSDCEILHDSSGKIREEWEKAASKKKVQNRWKSAENHAKTSGSDAECASFFCEATENMNQHFHMNEETDAGLPFSNEAADFTFPDTLVRQSPLGKKLRAEEHLNSVDEGISFNQDEISKHKMSTQVHKQSTHDILIDDVTSSKQVNHPPVCTPSVQQHNHPPSVCTLSVQQENPSAEVFIHQTFDSQNLDQESIRRSPLFTSINSFSPNQNYLIGEREKHKESDEYKRAEEEEWASRQKQLRIQAEEAQRLRRRKRAETLRLLDVERRQKQRLEEVRESQKKDEETINLKERFRCDVKSELQKIELMYRDMASLLRGLGINVDGGRFPSSLEVNAAYKRALFRFHPDRASKTDIRQQVESEEKFKLISRLKEKLLPASH